MGACLELFLLDKSQSDDVIALARSGPYTAIEHFSVDDTLKNFAKFGQVLSDVVTGSAKRPSKDEMAVFGKGLFDFLFQGSLRDMYSRLPEGHVSLQILSDRREIKEVPWEYVVTPDCQPSPHRNRSVVRVHQTSGLVRTGPKSKSAKKIRVLFVSADPVDQTGVEWIEVQAVIERALKAHMPTEVTLKVVEGATRELLIQAIAREHFDVFHFFGHGVVDNGVGQLVLQDVRTQNSDYLSAQELAVALSGKGVRLAILSACLSGAGNHEAPFGVLASALITSGIPAVIANQYPIPIKSVAPFVGNVYSTLLSEGDIDKAVAEGRVALAIGIGGTIRDEAVVEWGIPTLYRLPDAQQLFKP